MENICLPFNQDEIPVLMKAMDCYSAQLMTEPYPTEETKRKVQILTNINNRICDLNQL